jgi:hypothetical protein
MKPAYFARFNLDLPEQCVRDCSGPGAADEPVAFWAGKLGCPIEPETLKAELKEYGAWDAEELGDHDDNWRRIIWIAACNIREEERSANK